MGEDHVWVGRNSRDVVAALGDHGMINGSTAFGAGLGNDPSEDDFGANRFEASSSIGVVGIAVSNSMATVVAPIRNLYNIGRIVDGSGTVDGAGHTYDPWYEGPQDPEIDREVRDIDENERPGIKRLLMFSILTLLLVACTQVDAGDAKDDLESSRTQVDQEIIALAKRLSDAFGGSPKIIKRRYLSCGSAPTEALQYTATSEAKTPEQVAVREVREILVDEGWKVTDLRPARGVSPETLFIKREDRRVAVGIKEATLTVGANGDCVRVTSEQANKLSGPIN